MSFVKMDTWHVQGEVEKLIDNGYAIEFFGFDGIGTPEKSESSEFCHCDVGIIILSNDTERVFFNRKNANENFFYMDVIEID